MTSELQVAFQQVCPCVFSIAVQRCQPERGLGGTRMRVEEVASTGDAVVCFFSFCRGIAGNPTAREIFISLDLPLLSVWGTKNDRNQQQHQISSSSSSSKSASAAAIQQQQQQVGPANFSDFSFPCTQPRVNFCQPMVACKFGGCMPVDLGDKADCTFGCMADASVKGRPLRQFFFWGSATETAFLSQ